jgi:hypothetical protein
MARRPDTRTLDLLAWKPPAAPALRYEEPEAVRAASLRASFLRAMSLAVEHSQKSREQVAADMAAYLGEEVSKTVLDQYMSEARETYTINVVRFLAFIHATRDFRLLSLLAEPFGLAVIEERYLAAVEEAMCAEQIEALERRQTMARRKWKGGGA